MLAHSQAKVQLYGRYLAKYLNIISQDRYTDTIHIYDLFSGEGIYENGEKGSPMIALDKIANCNATVSQMPKVKITFNDINPNVINKLKQCMESFPPPANCIARVYNQD